MSRQIEFFAVLLTCIGVAAGAVWHYAEDQKKQDMSHQLKEDSENLRLELLEKLADSEAKGYAETRSHYKSLESERALSPAESSRLEYNQEQMEIKQERVRMIQQVRLKDDK